jgi:hypothetical protein
MNNANWQAPQIEEAHVCLTGAELQDVCRALGNDPNEVVVPAPKPIGLVCVDEQGFDTRVNTQPGQRVSKLGGNKVETLQIPPNKSTNPDPRPKEPRVEPVAPASAKVRSGKTNTAEGEKSVEIDNTLPLGWKVREQSLPAQDGIAMDVISVMVI